VSYSYLIQIPKCLRYFTAVFKC